MRGQKENNPIIRPVSEPEARRPSHGIRPADQKKKKKRGGEKEEDHLVPTERLRSCGGGKMERGLRLARVGDLDGEVAVSRRKSGGDERRARGALGFVKTKAGVRLVG